MRILNLYSGIGGNRIFWGENHEITAIEINKDIANIYKSFFKNDTVIITDAHDYLINNFYNFDFIWSSIPCQSHSKLNFLNFAKKTKKYVYPDFKIYEEIIFLKQFYKGFFVVENVKPYYLPLIAPTFEIDRHFFWSNFVVSPFKSKIRNKNITNQTFADYKNFGINTDFAIKNKTTVLRNCVHSKIGEHILRNVEFFYKEKNRKQANLF